MKIYDTEHIRNVAVLGHGGTGKTTLIEAFAYATGVTKRMGRVEDGNTISDFDKEETKRLFSIDMTMDPIEYGDVKINFLDTPGYFDFAGEVEEALSAADAVVIVVDAKSGVEVGTIRAFEYCEREALPSLVFVTGMDDAQANYDAVLSSLKEEFGQKIIPFFAPVRDGENLTGAVSVINSTGVSYTANGGEEPCDAPADMADFLEENHESLMEAVAETDEDMMDRYFMGDEFSDEEIGEALAESVKTCSTVPVLCGSGLKAQGVKTLLDAVCKYFPAPSARTVAAKNTADDSDVSVTVTDDAKPTAKVFKTLVDPFIGKYSMIKVCTGVLKSDSTVFDLDTNSEERVGKLYVLRGKESIEVKELHAGDLGALAKTSKVGSGDTLSEKGSTIYYRRPNLPVPYTYKRYEAVNKGDMDKVVAGFAKLMDEDLTLKTVNDAENHQTLIYGLGDQHIDVAVSRLESRYKVKVELMKPRFAFRETIRSKANVTGVHKKQSGGHGQYGVVVMDFEPSGNLDESYEFEEKVVGGAIPKNYFPAIEKGIQESVQRGPLAGYPVVGLKATLLDGKYHPVDSSDMAFKTAATIAFRQGVMKADPVLLEPIATLSVVVPDRFSGDVMGDLNKRRGRILGMDHIEGGKQKITADIPMSELYGYSTDLRSMTGGIGDFSYEFARYEQAPADVQKKEIEARAQENN